MGQLDDLEAQARPGQLAAVQAKVAAELLAHVGHHPVVGRGGRAEDADAGGQRGEHVGDPPVVGPEVVAPVRDAVRLVDDEQAGARGEQRQHRLAEGGVVQPLGADQEQVDGVLGEEVLHPRPLVAVGRVDRVRAQAEALGRRQLVAHEREQGADDERRARAALAQHRRRDEVDGALAPAGPLHAQDPRVVVDEVGDRLELMLAERRVGVAREAAEVVGGRGLDRHGHTRR
jgi:hypothetical protein